jgi:hypothetical protein
VAEVIGFHHAQGHAFATSHLSITTGRSGDQEAVRRLAKASTVEVLGICRAPIGCRREHSVGSPSLWAPCGAMSSGWQWVSY